jgi:hypothetical protein
MKAAHDFFELVCQAVFFEDSIEYGLIDLRLFKNPDDAFSVLCPSRLEGDGGQVLGFDDLGFDAALFQGRRIGNGFANKVLIGRNELNGKAFDEDRFGLIAESALFGECADRGELVQPLSDGDEEHVQVVGQDRLDVIRSGDSAPDRIGFDDPQTDHLFDDEKRFLHRTQPVRL